MRSDSYLYLLQGEKKEKKEERKRNDGDSCVSLERGDMREKFRRGGAKPDREKTAFL